MYYDAILNKAWAGVRARARVGVSVRVLRVRSRVRVRVRIGVTRSATRPRGGSNPKLVGALTLPLDA